MTGEHTAYRGTIRVKDRKRVPATTGHGFTSVDDGESDITFIATLDLNLLAHMAVKASRNKRGRSVDGPLLVEVLKRVKVL